jgi:hypothetical protein
LQGFTRLAQYVQKFYINDQPRHIASPTVSNIAVIESTTFQKMSVSEVQSLLRKKHILVNGWPQLGAIEFDGNGLRSLANLDAAIDIQGKA